ncbi:hypothetical protein [Luteimonas sp. A478]
MGKRFWICSVMVGMTALVLGLVVHGLLLRGDYIAHAELYRSQAEASARFGWILIAYALIGLSMTWLYYRLHDSDEVRLQQGLAFGIAIGLVSFVPWHLLVHAAQPLPLSLMLRQSVLDLVAAGLLGMLLAWLRPRRRELTLPD